MANNLFRSVRIEQSLRQTRVVYSVYAVVFFLPALGGAVLVVGGLLQVIMLLVSGSSESSLLECGFAILLGSACIYIEYALISNALEASRRIRKLRQNPAEPIREMPAPLQSWLFHSM